MKNDVNAVVVALEQANNASNQAEIAKNRATEDITSAEQKISEVSI